MAKDNENAPSLDQQQQALAGMISSGITNGIIEAQNRYGPIKQIPLVRHVPKTPWNPGAVPETQRPQLTRRYFQNGFAIDPQKTNDEQRLLLNQLKPGTYCDRVIDVSERYPDNGEPNVVDIRYNNATIEQRMELKGRFRSLTEMLKTLVREQKQLVGAA